MAEKKEFSVWDPAIAVPFIKSNEGCRLASYRDPAGVWTVGMALHAWHLGTLSSGT